MIDIAPKVTDVYRARIAELEAALRDMIEKERALPGCECLDGCHCGYTEFRRARIKAEEVLNG